MENNCTAPAASCANRKLTQELGQALVKDDLDKAKAELKELADKALARAAAADKQQMAEALSEPPKRCRAGPTKNTDGQTRRASQKTSGRPKTSPRNSAKAKRAARRKRKLEQQIEKNPNDSDARRKLDELKQVEQKLAEQLLARTGKAEARACAKKAAAKRAGKP